MPIEERSLSATPGLNRQRGGLLAATRVQQQGLYQQLSGEELTSRWSPDLLQLPTQEELLVWLQQPCLLPQQPTVDTLHPTQTPQPQLAIQQELPLLGMELLLVE